jgi:hypothetical protein
MGVHRTSAEHNLCSSLRRVHGIAVNGYQEALFSGCEDAVLEFGV